MYEKQGASVFIPHTAEHTPLFHLRSLLRLTLLRFCVLGLMLLVLGLLWLLLRTMV